MTQRTQMHDLLKIHATKAKDFQRGPSTLTDLRDPGTRIDRDIPLLYNHWFLVSHKGAWCFL